MVEKSTYLRVAQLQSALDPENIKIDSRDCRDRLAFAARFSELILYYNKDNRVSGNWLPFMVKDPVILLAVISKAEYSAYHAQFVQLKKNLLATTKNAWLSSACVMNLNALFELLKKIFRTINEWVKFMLLNSRKYDLREFVISSVSGSISEQLRRMVSIQKFLSIKSSGLVISPGIGAYDDFDAIWYRDYQREYHMRDKFTNAELAKMIDADVVYEDSPGDLLDMLWEIYHKVLGFFVRVIDSAKSEFYSIRTQSNDYPDTSLLIAFSQLLEIQKTKINEYSARHLDFYYKDILFQAKRTAQADQAYVLLKLADGVQSLSLPAGTEFNAGSYPDKSDILFATEASCEINRASISKVNTVYYLPDDSSANNLARGSYISVITDADKIKRNSDKQIVRWPAFGDTTGQMVSQGFAFASPMLYLQDGERSIVLDFVFQEPIDANFIQKSRFFLSTKKTWWQIKDIKFDYANIAAGKLTCTLSLDAAAPAIEKFTANPDGISSQWPMLKVLLDNSVALLKPPGIKSLTISAQVNKSSKFKQANTHAFLPPGTPAQMFGPIPELGDYYYIGSEECFAKPLTSMTVTIGWDHLPLDFSQYYAPYNYFLDPESKQPDKYFSNTAFSGGWSLLTEKSWNLIPVSISDKKTDDKDKKKQGNNTVEASDSEAQQVTLFQQQQGNNNTASNDKLKPGENLPTSTFKFDFTNISEYIPTPDLQQKPLAMPNTSDAGYIRFSLNQPGYAFAHDLYAKVVTNIITQNAELMIDKASTGLISAIVDGITDIIKHDKPSDHIQQLPNQPYSPRLTSLLGDYSATHTTIFSDKNNSYPLEFYHYGNFKPYQVYDALNAQNALGWKNLLPTVTKNGSVKSSIPLFTGVAGPGCLYIGLKDVQAPGTVSLFVELGFDAESQELDSDSVNYLFWSESGWQRLKVLINDTNNLNCSGIIKFEIPQLTQAQTGLSYAVSPILPGNEFWLAITTNKTNVKLNIAYINSQAVKLKRQNLNGVEPGVTPFIAENTISSPHNKISQIDSVVQPFASYGGVAAEDNKQMRWRVSNRLNNKDRVSSNVDFVSMAHDACEDLYYAKAFQNNANGLTRDAKPGEIYIGLVNGYRNTLQADVFRPRVNTCDISKIYKYFLARSSAMATIKLFNFKHQVVRIKAVFAVADPDNASSTLLRLNQKLKMYLSPWIKNNTPSASLQTGISRSGLIRFMLADDQVTQLEDLEIQLMPIAAKPADKVVIANTEIIVPAQNNAIFVSAQKHDLMVNFTDKNISDHANTATEVVRHGEDK